MTGTLNSKSEKTQLRRKPNTMTVSATRRIAGFTAMEIAMVATVIAILSLIVLPLFRNRVEEAKKAAAAADLNSLMKAEILAKADSEFYFRLEDLDNAANNNPATVPATGITVETPPFVYFLGIPPSQRRGLFRNEWNNLAGASTDPKFKGPYIAFQHSITYGELKDSAHPALRTVNGGDVRYPIFDLPTGDPLLKDAALFDSRDNRIPVDPWGQPYLFFPSTGTATFPNSTESGYVTSVIYSTGPDQQPGISGGGVPANYLRSTGKLAESGSDDLKVEF